VPYAPEGRVERVRRKWTGRGDLAGSLARATKSLIDLYLFTLRLDAQARALLGARAGSAGKEEGGCRRQGGDR
jgi:hypothetical protein